MSDGQCPSCGKVVSPADCSVPEVAQSAIAQSKATQPAATQPAATKLQHQLSIPTHFDLFWIMFSLKGRLSLGMLWISTLISIILAQGPFYLAYALNADLNILAVLFLLGLAFTCWSSIAIATKRLHDLGLPGWFVFLGLFPIFSPFFLFSIGCLKGRTGSNVYGLDPRRIWSAGMIDEVL
ncbi:MAG: DUF805 domain-containing protein [Pirellulaceae bacterium]|nr:DUF805 domain-containing protein [Pirellulaceae bacterium]